MGWVLVAVLAGHTYQATPVSYIAEAECKHVAWVMSLTSRRTKYVCKEK